MKVVNNLDKIEKFNIDELLNFCAKELKISDNVTLTIVCNKKLLENLSKKVEYEAILCNPFKDNYILYTRNNTVSQYVICHEMIHMEQHERGDLQVASDCKTIIWKGELFDNSITYEDREWEQEAFTKQNWLWRKFKQSQRKQNKNRK